MVLINLTGQYQHMIDPLGKPALHQFLKKYINNDTNIVLNHFLILNWGVAKDYYKYKTSSLKKVVSHIVSNWFSWPLIGQTIAFKASSHMKNWFFITKAVFWTSLLTILFGPTPNTKCLYFSECVSVFLYPICF